MRESLPRVVERIESARARAGGRDVTLVAVTKGHPPEAVVAAHAAGLRVCGENRVQELAAKRLALSGQPAERVEWHLIGHLQRNKVKKSLPLFRLIHSLDSERLAAELSKEAVRTGDSVSALLEVSLAGEEAKSGFRNGDELVAAAARMVALPSLRLLGLMTMAPFTADQALLHATFRRTRELFERCAREVSGFEARHLSMGMSNDFEVAIEEGSTMIRLGTVLFGERKQ